MFVLDGVELVCPVCRGELDIVQGNELFGILSVGHVIAFTRWVITSLGYPILDREDLG